jgi:hypothetical protein
MPQERTLHRKLILNYAIITASLQIELIIKIAYTVHYLQITAHMLLATRERQTTNCLNYNFLSHKIRNWEGYKVVS